MEVTTKRGVEIIQELLAIYSSGKEAIEEIEQHTGDPVFKEKLNGFKVQTDRFIEALMEELSLYGDAVMAEVNRNNNYLTTWKRLSPQLSEIDEADVQQQFGLLEKQLADYYQQVNATRSQEAGSLDELIKKQEAELIINLKQQFIKFSSADFI